MKNFLLSIMLFAFISCSDELPVDKVPSVVQNALITKFPGAVDIDWKKNTTGFEAEFDLNKVEYTIHIDSTGKLLLTKYNIKAEEFPVAVTAKINTDYTGYKIDDAEKIEQDTLIYYQAELEGKGKKDIHLVLLPDGSLANQIKYLN